MAINVKVSWADNSFDAKLENLSGKGEARRIRSEDGVVKTLEMKDDGSPKLIRRTPEGKLAEFTRLVAGSDLPPEERVVRGVENAYIDDDGKVYFEPELQTFLITDDGQEIPATKNEKTDVFEIVSFEPLTNFLDKYIMERYYQVMPSQGDSKKDYAKKVARASNTVGMKKLWDYLIANNVVGRGMLNPTSAGWLPNYGYIRAITIEHRWTLEVGMFKQQKNFLWVEEQNLQPAVKVISKSKAVDI